MGIYNINWSNCSILLKILYRELNRGYDVNRQGKYLPALKLISLFPYCLYDCNAILRSSILDIAADISQLRHVAFAPA